MQSASYIDTIYYYILYTGEAEDWEEISLSRFVCEYKSHLQQMFQK